MHRPSASLCGVCILFLTSALPAEESDEEKGLQMIRVIPGDTLHGVAGLYLKDPTRWRELLKYNVINSGDPDLLNIGDKLLVPVREIKESMRAAHLIEKIRQVDFRTRGGTLFQKASLNQKIFYEDAIRTFSDSYAKVLFPTKEVTKISPNTLAIIKPREIDQEVELIKGEIHFRKAKVQTPSSVITPSEDGLYRANVLDDKTTEVEVYEGNVGVSDLKGMKTIELKKGFGSKIAFGKMPLPPEKIKMPDMGELETFKNDLTLPATFHLQSLKVQEIGVFKPDEMDFEKEVSKRAPSRKKIKQVEIALDEYFSQVVLKAPPEEIQKKIAKLVDGKYYYRIENEGHRGGEYSDVKSFVLDRKNREMNIIILYPPANLRVKDEFVEVRGSSSRDIAKLCIETVDVELGKDGSFSQIIYLPMGPHDVEILFYDKIGNAKRETRRVVRVEKEKGFWGKLFGD
ncbi:MAG: hypothetical protein COT16_01815 [Elusimicrobia bacterium CG08_land_8_20_14_0_20_44_26]|nr:MAG: hypothetical protein COT16_01815 [Elusimicrobia bacterium CG08_land_8_20_14_0_20_44_26]